MIRPNTFFIWVSAKSSLDHVKSHATKSEVIMELDN